MNARAAGALDTPPVLRYDAAMAIKPESGSTAMHHIFLTASISDFTQKTGHCPKPVAFEPFAVIQL